MASLLQPVEFLKWTCLLFLYPFINIFWNIRLRIWRWPENNKNPGQSDLPLYMRQKLITFGFSSKKVYFIVYSKCNMEYNVLFCFVWHLLFHMLSWLFFQRRWKIYIQPCKNHLRITLLTVAESLETWSFIFNLVIYPYVYKLSVIQLT